ncbi:MAG: hypothetical protein HRU09_20025 [Oligoflexales bacterium]|nr:hypothetical protein [Oligoflexales bacterium]
MNSSLALVKMFAKERFDTMTIVDRKSAEEALKKVSFADYEYALFSKPKPAWNFFGTSKSFGQKAKLQKILTDMVTSGEITKIYKKYDVDPLCTNPKWVCLVVTR